MNTPVVALFDIMSCITVVFCIVLVLIRWKSIQWLDYSFIILQLSLAVFFINNLLKSTSSSVALDQYEPILLPFIWSFWFFSMLKKIQLIELEKARDELQISEQKTLTLLQNLPQKIFLKNSHSEYITCNENYSSDFSRKPEEITGKTDYDFYPLEMAEKYRIDDHRIMENGKTEEIEEKYLQNGKQLWMHTTKTPIMDEKGNVTGILGIFCDITERKQIEEELRENVERYRALVETSQDLIWQCDREGRYIYLNPVWEEIFGYPLNELIGRKFSDFQYPEIAARDLKEFERLKNGDIVKGYKTRHIGRNGKVIHLIFNARPVHSATGEVIGSRGTAHDITELESAVEKYQSLFNNMVDGFSFNDMIFDNYGNPVDFRFLEVNPAFERITGLHSEEIIGKTVLEVLPGIERHWIDIYGRVASSGEAVSFENYSQNLKKHFFVTAFRPAPGQFASIFVDITDRILAEQALRESEERLRTILNSLADAVIATDTKGVITRLNPAAERLTGWQNGEAVGKPLTDVFVIINSDSREMVPDPIVRVLHTGTVMSLAKNTKLISRNDCEFQISDSVAPIRGVKGEITGVVLVFHDVTEEYAIKEALQESEERYRLFYETSPYALMAVKSFNLCNPNRSAMKLFGISAEEMKNTSPWELSPERQPDGSFSSDKAMYYIKEALAGHPQFFEWRHQRRDGTQFDAEVALTRVYLSGEPQITATVIDITNRKNALKRLETSLHEKETLLQEIYHRTKNNMMVISSFLDLQAASVNNKEVDRIIHDSITRIRTMSLAHEMLYKGKSLSRINMRDYLTGLAKILATGSGISPEQVSLQFNIAEIEMLIDIAIPCGLIVNELLSNCFKYAFPGQGKGYIAIGLKRIGEKQVEMSVRDNGVGLPEGFDIMQTDTLGVQLVTQIARHQLHATIRVVSENGLSWYIAFREDLYSERV